jgi:hypothetical protein
MRIHPLVVSGLLFVGSACAASAALAGQTPPSYYAVGVSTSSFSGSLSMARYSPDSFQFIGCYTSFSTLPYGTPVATQCFAENSSGTQKACYTTNPDFAQAAGRINPTSYVYVTFDSGYNCTSIEVQNASWGLH